MSLVGRGARVAITVGEVTLSFDEVDAAMPVAAIVLAGIDPTTAGTASGLLNTAQGVGSAIGRSRRWGR